MWGTICNDGWGLNDAQVACNQLGVGNATSALSTLYPIGSNVPIHLSNVRCIGNESSLLSCPHNTIGDVGTCTHSNDVAIVCGSPAVGECLVFTLHMQLLRTCKN